MVAVALGSGLSAVSPFIFSHHGGKKRGENLKNNLPACRKDAFLTPDQMTSGAPGLGNTEAPEPFELLFLVTLCLTS